MKNKNESKKAFFIILLIVTISIIIIILTIFKSSYFFKKDTYNLLKIPTIKTTIYSNSSNKSYFVNLSLCLDINPSFRKKIDISTVKINIEKLISSLDFDNISSNENTKYIKDAILKDIYNYTPKNSIKNIYISDIISARKKSVS